MKIHEILNDMARKNMNVFDVFLNSKRAAILCNLKEVILGQIQENPTLHHNSFFIICKRFGKTDS